MKKVSYCLGTGFSILCAIKEWTSLFNHITATVFMIYAIICLLSYLSCVISNAYLWVIKLSDYSQKMKNKNSGLNKKYRKLKENRDGLKNQRKLDLEDKDNLQKQVLLLKNLLNIANLYIDPTKTETYKNHIIATKEINFEHKDCKNNK